MNVFALKIQFNSLALSAGFKSCKVILIFYGNHLKKRVLLSKQVDLFRNVFVILIFWNEKVLRN